MTALRFSSAIWLVPLLFAAGVFIGFSNSTPDETYSIAVFAAASRSVIVIGPLLAAAIAFKAGVLATFLKEKRAARGVFASYLQALWPLLILGPFAAFVAVAWVAGALPTTKYTLAICAVLVLTALGCGAFGLAVGLVVPRLFAAPVCAVAAYLWLAFPATGGSALLRNINGSFVGCCTLDQYPAASMLSGSTFLLLVVIGGALVVVNVAPRRALAGGVLVATLLAALGVGSAATRSVDATPSLMAVQARTGATTCSSAGAVELCVWPEHASRLGESSAVVASAVAKLQSVGLTEISSKYSEDPRSGYQQIQVADEAGDVDIAFTLVTNLLPDIQTCRPSESVDVYAAYAHALQWLSLKVGLSVDDISQRLGSSVAGSVLEIDTKSNQEQVAWFDSIKTTLDEQCKA